MSPAALTAPPDSRRAELATVAIANALPLAGVVVLDWSVAALVLVYWFELGSLLAWGTLRAVFAQRPSRLPNDSPVLGALARKRGHLSIPFTDVGLRFQHLPIIAVIVPFLAFLWLLAGAASVGAIEAATGPAAVDRPGVDGTVGLGVLVVIASHGVSTVGEYFLGGEFREVSAQRVLRRALWPIVATGAAMVAAAAFLGRGSGTLLLVVLVGVKLGIDLVGVYRDRLRAFDERTDVDWGWANDPPERPTVDGDLDGPVTTVRPRRLAIVVDGISRGLRTGPALMFGGLFALLALGLLAIGAFDAAALLGGLAAAVLALAALVGILDRSLRHLTVEYRVAGDVVAYDWLLGEPQWRVAGWKVDRAGTDRTVADRLFGTETVVVEDRDRTFRLPHLPDAAALLPEQRVGSDRRTDHDGTDPGPGSGGRE